MSETYRNIRESDFEDMHASVSTWDVVRQLGSWPWPPSEDFTRSRAKPYEGDGFIWAVCREDRYIGSIALTGEEIGYGLHPDYQRQGIMPRALAKAVEEGFEGLGRSRLVATVWHDNYGSAALLKRFGFTHWLTRYEHAKARGLPVLCHHYRLMREDWKALRDKGE